MPLTDFMIWLTNKSVDGILTIDSGTNQTRLAISDGHILRAQATEKRTTLGQFLVNESLITEDQLQTALKSHTAGKLGHAKTENAQTLGHYLVEQRILRRSAIEIALRSQITELTLETMTWESGVFVFNKIPVAKSISEIPTTVNLENICRRAKKRAPLWRQYRSQFSNLKGVLALSPEHSGSVHPFDGLDERILSFAAYRMTVESAVLELHAPRFQLYERLSKLIRKGYIQIESPDPDEPNTLDIKFDNSDGVDHGHSARRAFESEDYREALGHANAELSVYPEDDKLKNLRREAQARLTAKLTSELPSLDAVPRLLKSLEEVRKARRLSAKEHYILSRVDGIRSLGAIVRVSPMRDIDAFKLFQNFVVSKVLSFE